MLGYKLHIAPVSGNRNDVGQHRALQAYVVENDGEFRGRLEFGDLQKEGSELLDFNPRGEMIEACIRPRAGSYSVS
jgi:hypothetical protein